MAELTIQKTQVAQISLVVLMGELDAYHAPRVKEELEAELAQSTHTFVISLKRVSYIDSTGLGVLVALRKQAEQGGTFLSLVVSPESAVHRTFTITGLLPVFTLFDEEAAALEAAAPKEG